MHNFQIPWNVWISFLVGDIVSFDGTVSGVWWINAIACLHWSLFWLWIQRNPHIIRVLPYLPLDTSPFYGRWRILALAQKGEKMSPYSFLRFAETGNPNSSETLFTSAGGLGRDKIGWVITCRVLYFFVLNTGDYVLLYILIWFTFQKLGLIFCVHEWLVAILWWLYYRIFTVWHRSPESVDQPITESLVPSLAPKPENPILQRSS